MTAALDHFFGAMEVEEADILQSRRDHRIGRVAGKPRTRDAILNDIEGIDHNS